jgi:type VI secretion system protein ImpC
MAGRLEFDFGFKGRNAGGATRRGDEDPMRILILADLSGREARGVHEPGDIATRSILNIDVDNFDDVMGRIAPTLPWSGVTEDLAFRTMDDFHPDTLYSTLPVFARLRDLRKKLLDSSTAAQAMAELGTVLSQPVNTGDEAVSDGEPQAPTEDDSAMIERLLGSSPTGDAPQQSIAGKSPAAAADALIARIVLPHIVPDAPPHRDAYLQAVNDALSDHMRSVLHHPKFQAIEAAWRGVEMLVSELSGEETLALHLFDVSRRELAEDLQAADGKPEATGAYARLVVEAERTTGASPWSVLVGAYEFGPDEDQMRLCAALGALASAAGGPLLACADSRLVGAPEIAENPDSTKWDVKPEHAEVYAALRTSGAASWIGLALPGVILRQPYGKGSDEIDSFEFEEMSSPPDHDAYLWGNPGFHLALLLGRSFSDSGWGMQPGDINDLSDLPSHIHIEDREKILKPCAEVLLSERAADAVIKLGLMPLLSYRDRNTVRVPRMQSIADPAAGLSGAWA